MINFVRNWIQKIEEDLYWWLERRWRERSTAEQIENRRQWLTLDISIKNKEKQKRKMKS